MSVILDRRGLDHQRIVEADHSAADHLRGDAALFAHALQCAVVDVLFQASAGLVPASGFQQRAAEAGDGPSG